LGGGKKKKKNTNKERKEKKNRQGLTGAKYSIVESKKMGITR